MVPSSASKKSKKKTAEDNYVPVPCECRSPRDNDFGAVIFFSLCEEEKQRHTALKIPSKSFAGAGGQIVRPAETLWHSQTERTSKTDTIRREKLREDRILA